MNYLKTAASTAAILCFAAASFASEEAQTKIRIAVVDDATDDEIHLDFDSEEMGFNLHDMQVGENRSIIDKSGQSVLITRNDDGFVLDVGGKRIELPAFDGEHHGNVRVSADHGEDVDVHVMKDANFVSAEAMSDIMIISGEPIDEATQQAIKSLLESSGRGSDVSFIDHEQRHGDGGHQVKVIRRSVEIKD
jgi:hypothetical protein